MISSLNVSRLACYRHRSLVKVITRETGCGLLVLVCCVSVPDRVRIQRARCWFITVNWQSAPTFCCSLLPRCCLPQKRRETLEGGCLRNFFSVSPSVHAHKAVIMSTNCTSCHIFARQETDIGHLENANATQPLILRRACAPCSWSYICV